MAEEITLTPAEKKEIREEKRKQERFMVLPEFSKAQKELIRRMYAKGLSDDEFAVFIYRCRSLGLDPMKGEISCQVRNADDPEKRQVITIVQRDGYLTIAHRSAQFGGIKSGSRLEGEDEIVGWAIVWNKSAPQPVEIEVYLSEYSPLKTSPNEGWKYPLWKNKPRTMIAKVAESQALRRAFNISGVYSTEEVDRWEEGSVIPNNEDQLLSNSRDEIVARIEAAKKSNTKIVDDTFKPQVVQPQEEKENIS